MEKQILIGVTGGIAAFKTLELVESLKKAGYGVSVIMTESATRIVSPEKFENASGNKVSTQLFSPGFDYKKILQERKVDHIELAKHAAVLVIIPATADIIAKITYGIADDFLTTTVLAATCPIILCPSMNVAMWNNLITQENIAKLTSRGIIIIDPDEGMLACGYEGQGRLADIPKIYTEIMNQTQKTTVLQRKKIIVTAGGTIEHIDDVRFIANKSSGKMGVAIADACYLKGADVLLIRSASSVKSRYITKEEIFETVEDLEKILKKYAPEYDMCFHAAAVSDFTIVNPKKGKIASNKTFHLMLTPQKKILSHIKAYNPKIQLIGFKAVWNKNEQELITAAKKTLRDAKADFIIANDVGKVQRGFQFDTNEVFVVDKQEKTKHVPFGSKKIVAEKIIEYIFNIV